MSNAELLWDCRCRLGEGALWSAAEQALYFVDIEGRAVLRCDATGAARSRWPVPQMLGWVVPRQGGGWLAGFQQGIVSLSLNADETAGHELLHPLHDPDSPLRLNDAKVDAQGTLWFGSMNHPDMSQPVGVFYRLHPGSAPEAVDTGYRVTNGPTFSPDGRTLYHADTPLRCVYAFDCDPGGALSNKRPWVRFAGDEGYPDGMTTDAEGNIWIAHWGGSRVTQRDPDGRIIRTIQVAAAQVTDVAFGSADLSDLFITSALTGLDAATLSAAPASGGLFVVRGAGNGLPSTPFGG